MMILRSINIAALSSMIGLAVATAVVSASAAQPFYYYPAYGAQRGRIVYRQGPFGGTRQKIHWGGGLTDNGTSVLLSAIGAAETVFGPGDSSANKEAQAARDAEFKRSIDEDRRLLAEAKALRARTEALRNQFAGGQTSNGKPPPLVNSGSLDNFSDW